MAGRLYICENICPCELCVTSVPEERGSKGKHFGRGTEISDNWQTQSVTLRKNTQVVIQGIIFRS